MPNGQDKNWIRLCAAVDGFRIRYGRWPTRVRMPATCMNDFKHLFTARDILTITAKIRFALDDEPFVAEDDDGPRYSCGDENVSGVAPAVSAREWFGVSPMPESEMRHLPEG